ncbi:MAG: DUF2975 domain-containing protein [Cyclobacteriaceae bacterium]
MKKHLSLRLLSLLTRIFFWGTLVLIGIVMIIGIVIMTGKAQEVKLGIPSSLKLNREIIYLPDSPVKVEVEFETGSIKVPVRHLSNNIIWFVLSSTILALACVAYIVFNFKKFMSRVLDGDTFSASTIQFLRNAAVGFFAMEVLGFIAETIGYFLIKQRFDLLDFNHPFTVSFPSLPIILALVLWGLAHIFSKGKELEDEQKLTV